MPKFSQQSSIRLSQVHPLLQRLLMNAIKYIDFTIVEGHRTEARQKELFAQGLTKTMNSKHLAYPSQAVDIAPYPYPDMNNPEHVKQVYYMAGFIKGLASAMGIKIRIGADWNGNNDIRDEKWSDAWHIEIMEV